jgi:hypothetical protein
MRYGLELKYSSGVASSDTISELPQREDAKRLLRKAIIKSLIKVVNHSHLFPMRYALELKYSRGVASSDAISEPTQCEDAKKTVEKSDNQTSHKGR